MPKRISKPMDPNQAAFQMVQRTAEVGQTAKIKKTPQVSRRDISRIMSEMGKKGGKIGGKRSLETLTAEQRRERALQAARARWAKKH